MSNVVTPDVVADNGVIRIDTNNSFLQARAIRCGTPMEATISSGFPVNLCTCLADLFRLVL